MVYEQFLFLVIFHHGDLTQKEIRIMVTEFRETGRYIASHSPGKADTRNAIQGVMSFTWRSRFLLEETFRFMDYGKVSVLQHLPSIKIWQL